MANYSENKKYHFTYKTTNLINGKYYLGMHSTNFLNDGYLGSGKRLYYELKKYGKNNFQFEIIKYYNSRQDLILGEIDLISNDDLNNPNCLNLKNGGTGGIMSKEHHKKMIEKAKIINSRLLKDLWNDEKRSSERSKNISKSIKKLPKEKLDLMRNGNKSWVGKKHKPETIDKMKIKAIGKGLGNTNSQYGTIWITNGIENKKIKNSEIVPEGWKHGRILS